MEALFSVRANRLTNDACTMRFCPERHMTANVLLLVFLCGCKLGEMMMVKVC